MVFSEKLRLPLLFIILQSISILRLGGDWMPAYRFMVPILSFSAIIISEMYHNISSSLRKCLLIFFLFITAFSFWKVHLHLVSSSYNNRFSYIPSFQLVIESPYIQAANYLITNSCKDDLVAIGDAGIIPYLSGNKILDLWGLMDKKIAKMPMPMGSKIDTAYLISRSPKWIVLYDKNRETGLFEKK